MSEIDNSPQIPDRRRFLNLAIQGSALIIVAVTAIPGIALLLAPVFSGSKGKKRKLVFPKPDNAKSTTFVPVRFEKQEETAPGLYFRMDGGKPMVLWARCPHAGCAVEWHGTDNQFVCPCHQGRFDASGKNISGPPPRPLERLTATIAGNDIFIEEPEA